MKEVEAHLKVKKKKYFKLFTTTGTCFNLIFFLLLNFICYLFRNCKKKVNETNCHALNIMISNETFKKSDKKL